MTPTEKAVTPSGTHEQLKILSGVHAPPQSSIQITNKGIQKNGNGMGGTLNKRSLTPSATVHLFENTNPGLLPQALAHSATPCTFKTQS